MADEGRKVAGGNPRRPHYYMAFGKTPLARLRAAWIAEGKRRGYVLEDA